MKVILTIFVLSWFSIQLVFTQSVSVEISVIWVNGHDIFKEDSLLSFPKLNITYRNNTDTCLYFLKVSNSKKGNPMLPWGSFLQYPLEEYLNPDYKKRAISHRDYTMNDYTIVIGGGPLYAQGWIVYNDTLKTNEQEIDYINDDLADIYYYMYYHQYGKEPNNKVYFKENEIRNTKIDKTVRSAFVFLKPGEIYTDNYNLLPFKKLGGNFTFQIHDNKLFDYILVEPTWDKNQSKYLEKRIPLPKQVGKYRLYSGSFNTNKVVITF